MWIEFISSHTLYSNWFGKKCSHWAEPAHFESIKIAFVFDSIQCEIGVEVGFLDKWWKIFRSMRLLLSTVISTIRRSACVAHFVCRVVGWGGSRCNTSRIMCAISILQHTITLAGLWMAIRFTWMAKKQFRYNLVECTNPFKAQISGARHHTEMNASTEIAGTEIRHPYADCWLKLNNIRK